MGVMFSINEHAAEKEEEEEVWLSGRPLLAIFEEETEEFPSNCRFYEILCYFR